MNQLKIGDKYSFHDWGAYLAPSPVVGLPKPKTEYVEIPSGDGSVDLTESLTGDVKYEDRIITAELFFMPPRREWQHKLDAITNYIHGQRLPIQVPDDKEYYYMGRVSVSSTKVDGVVFRIELSMQCEPYKYKRNLTVYDLVIPTNGALNVDCKNIRQWVLPTITVNRSVNLTFENNSYSINAGSGVYTNIVFKRGINSVKVTSSAGTSVKISYREGAI